MPTAGADFPSSSPYVLSVGATEIAGGQTSSDFAAPICTSGTLSCASGGSEIVASNKVLAFFSSGGGFSQIAPRPSYQVSHTAAVTARGCGWESRSCINNLFAHCICTGNVASPVQDIRRTQQHSTLNHTCAPIAANDSHPLQDAVVAKYLKNTSALPPAGDFNTTGRAAPDVAALGHNYYIELGGSVSAVDGTSAATPVMAGMIANLNAWRLSNGKPVLGFVNPLM